jgi:hypothetical protein
MSSLDSFINTFFSIENVKNQRESQRLAQENLLLNQEIAKTQKLATFAELARLAAENGGVEALTEQFGDPGFADYFRSLVPKGEVMEDQMFAQGIQEMSPELSATVAEGTALGRLTGMSAGQFAADQFRAGLDWSISPEDRDLLSTFGRAGAVGTDPVTMRRTEAFSELDLEEVKKGLRIELGLELDAFQEETVAQWAADNGYKWADLAQRGAFGMAEIALAADRMSYEMAASDLGLPSPNTLMTTLMDALESLEDKSLPDAQRAVLITVFNATADNLSLLNLFPPEVRLPTELENYENSILSMKALLGGVVGAAGGAIAGGAIGARTGRTPAAALGGAAAGGVAGLLAGARFSRPNVQEAISGVGPTSPLMRQRVLEDSLFQPQNNSTEDEYTNMIMRQLRDALTTRGGVNGSR